MSRYFWACLMFLLLGCTSPVEEEVETVPLRRVCFAHESKHVRTFPIHEFSAEELSEIHEVERRFKAFTGEPLELRGVEEDRCKNPSCPEELTPKVLGCYSSVSAEVLIQPSSYHLSMEQSTQTYDEVFQAVLLHEMLHSFGYEHVKTEGLMNAKLDTFRFTDADRTECLRVNPSGVCYSEQF